MAVIISPCWVIVYPATATSQKQQQQPQPQQPTARCIRTWVWGHTASRVPSELPPPGLRCSLYIGCNLQNPLSLIKTFPWWLAPPGLTPLCLKLSILLAPGNIICQDHIICLWSDTCDHKECFLYKHHSWQIIWLSNLTVWIKSGPKKSLIFPFPPLGFSPWILLAMLIPWELARRDQRPANRERRRERSGIKIQERKLEACH